MKCILLSCAFFVVLALAHMAVAATYTWDGNRRGSDELTSRCPYNRNSQPLQTGGEVGSWACSESEFLKCQF